MRPCDAPCSEAVSSMIRELLVPPSQKHECIGDVRGTGLMVGVELVRSKASKAPAPATGAAHTILRQLAKSAALERVGRGDDGWCTLEKPLHAARCPGTHRLVRVWVLLPGAARTGVRGGGRWRHARHAC